MKKYSSRITHLTIKTIEKHFKMHANVIVVKIKLIMPPSVLLHYLKFIFSFIFSRYTQYTFQILSRVQF